MKKLFFIIALLLSFGANAQTSINVDIFDKDSVMLTSAGCYQGDEIIIGITFTYTAPNDLNNPFLVKIANIVVFDGTLGEWANNRFYVKLPAPALAPNTSGPPINKYSYSITLNGNSIGGIKILPQTTTSIINPLQEKDINIEYYDISGLKIEQPSKGFFIWKAESGESGKIYIIN